MPISIGNITTKRNRLISILEGCNKSNPNALPGDELHALLRTPNIGAIEEPLLESALERMLNVGIPGCAHDMAITLDLVERWVHTKTWDVQNFWPQMQWVLSWVSRVSGHLIYEKLGEALGGFFEENLSSLAQHYMLFEGESGESFASDIFVCFGDSFIKCAKTSKHLKQVATTLLIDLEVSAGEAGLLHSLVVEKRLPLYTRASLFQVGLAGGHIDHYAKQSAWLHGLARTDSQRAVFACVAAVYGHAHALKFLRTVNKEAAEIIESGLLLEANPEDTLATVRNRTRRMKGPISMCLPTDMSC